MTTKEQILETLIGLIMFTAFMAMMYWGYDHYWMV